MRDGCNGNHISQEIATGAQSLSVHRIPHASPALACERRYGSAVLEAHSVARCCRARVEDEQGRLGGVSRIRRRRKESLVGISRVAFGIPILRRRYPARVSGGV